MDTSKQILIAVSISKFEKHTFIPQVGVWGRIVAFRAESLEREASFIWTQEGSLDEIAVRRCEQLQQHGFTVVEVTTHWRYDYETHPGGWKVGIIEKALKQVETLVEEHGEQIQVSGYNKELAREVLRYLDHIFPGTLSNMQLKRQLSVEPSDEVLLAALEALRKQGFIEGHEKRENITEAHRLIALRCIGITPSGQAFLEGQTSATPIANYYINHGQAGAMGPNANGTVNYQHQWSQIENAVSLKAIEDQFEQAIRGRMASPLSSSDFAELQLMAQAKEQAQKHEGGKLMETVSLIGKSAVPILTNAGAHAIVSWLEHKLGTKLS